MRHEEILASPEMRCETYPSLASTLGLLPDLSIESLKSENAFKNYSLGKNSSGTFEDFAFEISDLSCSDVHTS